jgi:uncharacterized protein
MDQKQIHLDYIRGKGSFNVDCNHSIFSTDELEILKKYGHWMLALANGDLEPFTELQREFLLVASNQKEAVSTFERAWEKYQGRKNVEAKYGDKLKVQYAPESDGFYNREMAKQQRKMMYDVIRKTHRG